MPIIDRTKFDVNRHTAALWFKAAKGSDTWVPLTTEEAEIEEEANEAHQMEIREKDRKSHSLRYAFQMRPGTKVRKQMGDRYARICIKCGKMEKSHWNGKSLAGEECKPRS